MKGWLWFLLIPIGFILGIFAGEGIYSLLGYEVGTTDAPVWVKLLSAALAYSLMIGSVVLSVKRWMKH